MLKFSRLEEVTRVPWNDVQENEGCKCDLFDIQVFVGEVQ